MTAPASEPQFTLYTHHTCPAAFKVANVLALLHLPFKSIYIQITRTIKDQKEPWFLELNPNGRLPVLIDHSQKQNGKDFHLWESGAIIHYLLTQYDTKHILWPTSIFLQSEINQWVHLHLTGQAVTIGQAFWFGYWHSEILPTAYKRYVDETKRILGVLEGRLAEPGRSWLVGDTMSIADVSFLAWYEEAFMVDVETEKDFPVVHKWLEAMRAIPEIQEGSVGREMIQPKKLWERS